MEAAGGRIFAAFGDMVVHTLSALLHNNGPRFGDVFTRARAQTRVLCCGHAHTHDSCAVSLRSLWLKLRFAARTHIEHRHLHCLFALLGQKLRFAAACSDNKVSDEGKAAARAAAGDRARVLRL